MVSGRYNYKDPELFDKPSIGFVNSGVFKKGLLFPKLNLFEDNLFVYAFLQTHTALVIPERLYTYNRHTPHSLSKERNNYSKEWLQEYLKIADEYISDHFTDKDYKEKYTKYFKGKVAKLKHCALLEN